MTEGVNGSEPPTKRIKVAVIGTGLAGLSTAYFLHQDTSTVEFEVHLFEKSNSLGMDSSSISVKTADGTFRVDSPMRSINGGSHDAVWQLYRKLKIELRKSDFSYTFSRLSNSLVVPCTSPTNATTTPTTPPPPYHATESPPPPDRPKRPERPAQLPGFIYEGSNGFKFPPLAIPSTFSWLQCGPYLVHMVLLSLAYLHLLALAFFYTWTGLSRARNGDGLRWIGLRNVGNEPLGAFCRRHWIWRGLREEVLEPLVAAVCTVGRDEVGDLPTEEILGYITATFGSSHFVAARGVQQVVAALAGPIPADRIHLSTTITDISPSPFDPLQKRLTFDSEDPATTTTLDFDHLVFATQANQAQVLLRLYQTHLEDAKAEKDEQERIDALGAFEYVSSLVVTHWDESMLPPNPRDRRDLNLASFATLPTRRSNPVTTDHTVARTSIQATHIISRTHPALTAALPKGTALMQTTNPIVRVDPSLVLSEAWYERARVSVAGKRVLPRFLIPRVPKSGEGDLQGARGIYFVGSWCAEGLPLLEGCVTSARSAVDSIRKKYN